MYDENSLYEIQDQLGEYSTSVYGKRDFYGHCNILLLNENLAWRSNIIVSPAISVINLNLKNGLVLCLGTQNSEMKVGYIKLG